MNRRAFSGTSVHAAYEVGKTLNHLERALLDICIIKPEQDRAFMAANLARLARKLAREIERLSWDLEQEPE
jgi:hypothetical protein